MEILSIKGDELSVRFGQGAFARVRITRRVLPHSGCIHISAEAYEADEQGILCVDDSGLPIKASFGHTMSAADSAEAEKVAASVRSAVAVVLGETPEIEAWAHDVHAEAHRNGSLLAHMGAHAQAKENLADLFPG